MTFGGHSHCARWSSHNISTIVFTVNKLKHRLPILFTLSASGMAYAQEAVTTKIDPISITASPFDKSSNNIAQPWSVISEEDLGKQLQPTLGETIGWQPGVSSTSYTTLLSNPVIGYGGGRVRIWPMELVRGTSRRPP